MPPSNDERLGFLLRTIRRRSGLRQADISNMAAVPRRDVVLVEAGRAGDVALDRVRRMFGAADARLSVAAWWRGAAADRLLDEQHAALVERAVQVMRRRGWEAQVEVSFSEYGERGSVDILGGHATTAAVAVCEVKGSFGSLEEMHRMLDVKERLAPKLALGRFGWKPRVLGRLLIVPDQSTIRRHIDAHASTMAAVYPARGREVREWLRKPDKPLRGIWFLSGVRNRSTDSGR